MLTPADLARLQQLHAQATPGTWEAIQLPVNVRIMAGDVYVMEAGLYGVRRAEDALAITESHNALPDLLALAALGLRVQEMRERIETYADEVIGANEPEAVNRLLRDLLARLDTGQER